MNLWTRPQYYIGASWPATYVFLQQHRDSDSVTRSNFACGLAALEALPAFESPDDELTSRFVVRESHCLVGWCEWIAIHADDAEGIKAAEAMESKIESYPILDENHHSELENDEAQSVWKDCYNDSERVAYIRRHRSQFDFNDFAQLMAVARGKYFNGYASELVS